MSSNQISREMFIHMYIFIQIYIYVCIYKYSCLFILVSESIFIVIKECCRTATKKYFIPDVFFLGDLIWEKSLMVFWCVFLLYFYTLLFREQDFQLPSNQSLYIHEEKPKLNYMHSVTPLLVVRQFIFLYHIYQNGQINIIS